MDVIIGVSNNVFALQRRFSCLLALRPFNNFVRVTWVILFSRLHVRKKSRNENFWVLTSFWLPYLMYNIMLHVEIQPNCTFPRFKIIATLNYLIIFMYSFTIFIIFTLFNIWGGLYPTAETYNVIFSLNSFIHWYTPFCFVFYIMYLWLIFLIKCVMRWLLFRRLLCLFCFIFFLFLSIDHIDIWLWCIMHIKLYYLMLCPISTSLQMHIDLAPNTANILSVPTTMPCILLGYRQSNLHSNLQSLNT